MKSIEKIKLNNSPWKQIQKMKRLEIEKIKNIRRLAWEVQH